MNRKELNELKPGTLFIHGNADLRIIEDSCDICGETESNSYTDGKCFVCWYNTNPGALRSP